jgi:hypothetical protein
MQSVQLSEVAWWEPAYEYPDHAPIALQVQVFTQTERSDNTEGEDKQQQVQKHNP